ncbi:MAG TPA: hypothetical protein VLT32_05810, partial [Candidatus Sulfomarinibacteraceae bacterium]|nr:hypothetical protein [Candidatus Sulfomarinibacteraceae bacterium]
MSWIEQNLDAYRVIAEILTDLRPLVRERLESKFGKEWFKDGIPPEVFDGLIKSKEQETSIDWYENRYQEVIDYAVFPDLFEIVTANAALFQPILKLAPSQSLLNTRFLELEVMRSKIGRARQVSDAEINFLTSFHLRFRKALQELRDAPIKGGGTPVSKRASGDAESTPPRPPRPDSDSDPAPAKTPPSEEEPAAAAAAGSSPRPPIRLASPTIEAATASPTTAAAPEGPPPDGEDGVAVVEDTEEEPEETPAEATNQRETVGAVLKRAMDSNDHTVVLRELYREVTGIAEVIWTTEEVPTTAIWDRVSTNPWYEKNFSKLELRPLSDFYEIISQVRAKRKARAPKSEIQTHLNDSNFA